MPGISPENFSYKDYTARVFKNDEKYFRAILPEYQQSYDWLMESGLYQKLIDEKLLIPHQEIDYVSYPGAYKVILPEQIEFLSLPFEWCYSQWRKVLLTYIEINLIALKYGMILKDATPYNFCLKAGKAILFDSSSFSVFNEPDYWIAYRQFCEEMLGPFALMHYGGMRWGRLTQASHQGLPLDFICKNLPIKSLLNFNCLVHLHLHAKSFNSPGLIRDKSKGFSIEKLTTAFHLIKKTILKWDDYYMYPTYWFTYYNSDIESEEYLFDKESTVAYYLKSIKVQSVVDLGANTGKFSELACEFSKRVIALEFDKKCVDDIENKISSTRNTILHTLFSDLSQTSPDFGLLGKEHKSIIARAKSDLVMALAIVHHLALTKLIPFEYIIELIFEFSKNYAIVEFIDKTDHKVLQLLENNSRYYPTQEEFEKKLQKKFKILEQKTLAHSARTLYLLAKC